ncbi:hypothetical protein GCM10011391_28050 [Pullulanibacillus camelliae]|uniref:Minor capsid protein n=1 Tax=Pullulanibacillus camelliae TaxID=1707096 RepID=A0A8J2YK37_9BACL|nr:putative minor capsid protein [Pullulanibacillus camelliae]GGE47663.1 hypothetical protein GCM10011391_28050 [Pullulanibacillus camelliae]
MPTIKPIPKRLLKDSIEYEEYQGNSNFGESWGEKETIDFVRFEPKTAIRVNDKGEEIQTTGIIFLDAINTPKFKALKVKSKVTCNGDTMRVHACNPYSAFKGIHHYEVEVV